MTDHATTKPHSSLFTAAGAAELLGLHERTVRKLLQRGEIKGINLASSGGRTVWRITADDLTSYIESKRVTD